MRWWCTNKLSRIGIVLAPWNNSAHVTPLTLSWFQDNKSLLLLLNAGSVLSRDGANINFISFLFDPTGARPHLLQYSRRARLPLYHQWGYARRNTLQHLIMSNNSIAVYTIIPLAFLPICYIVCKIVFVMNITVILQTWLLQPSNIWRGSHGHDLDLQLPMQSVPITTNVVHDAYSKHVHMIMFVSDLRQVDDFLWLFRILLPIKLTAMILLK